LCNRELRLQPWRIEWCKTFAYSDRSCVMSLSEYEQRVLDEIEQILSLDQPRLASLLRSPHAPRGRGLMAGLSLLWTGLAVVLLGVRADGGIGVALSVVGYLLIAASVGPAMTALRRRRRDHPR
jgi:hypothetical protein